MQHYAYSSIQLVRYVKNEILNGSVIVTMLGWIREYNLYYIIERNLRLVRTET